MSDEDTIQREIEERAKAASSGIKYRPITPSVVVKKQTTQTPTIVAKKKRPQFQDIEIVFWQWIFWDRLFGVELTRRDSLRKYALAYALRLINVLVLVGFCAFCVYWILSSLFFRSTQSSLSSSSNPIVSTPPPPPPPPIVYALPIPLSSAQHSYNIPPWEAPHRDAVVLSRPSEPSPIVHHPPPSSNGGVDGLNQFAQSKAEVESWLKIVSQAPDIAMYGISKHASTHCIPVEQVASLAGVVRLDDHRQQHDRRSMLLIGSANVKMGTISFRDVRYSILGHMVARNYDYMCGQHIDIPLSYCVLYLRESNSYLDVFNVDITGIIRGYALNRETKLVCNDSLIEVEVMRFQSIWAEMTLLDGQTHEKLFKDELSFSLQQIFELQNNLTPCQPDIKKFAQYVKKKMESVASVKRTSKQQQQ